jgi:serine/threonine protein kinase
VIPYRDVDRTLLAPGDAVDRYVVLSKLGEGGMGVVYLVRDTQLERRVALKILRPRGVDTSQWLEAIRTTRPSRREIVLPPGNRARHASAGWPGRIVGAFQNAMMESPMYLSTVPPLAAIAEVRNRRIWDVASWTRPSPRRRARKARSPPVRIRRVTVP